MYSGRLHGMLLYMYIIFNIAESESIANIWLGGNDLENESVFRWSKDNSLIDFSVWDNQEPNNHNGNEDCVCLWLGNLKWNDYGCTAALKFICQWR